MLLKSSLSLTTLLLLICCSCAEDEIILSKGEQNAQLMARILNDNEIQFVSIYEYAGAESSWKLAADSQRYEEGTTKFTVTVDGTYFVLDGTGSKTYVTGNTPTHQLSGFYYFDLTYLVSFDMSVNQDKLFLYFMYSNK